MLRRLCLIGICLLSFEVYAHPPEAPEKKVILGIGQAIMDQSILADPQEFDLLDEKWEQVSQKHLEKALKDCLESYPHPGGIMANALGVMQHLFRKDGDTSYDVQFFGAVGAQDLSFVQGLVRENITWSGHYASGNTGCCLVIRYEDKRSFLMYEGVSRSLNLDYLKPLLSQKNDLVLCLLDGFLLKKETPFGRENLINMLSQEIPPQRITLLLPSKEFLSAEGPDYFHNLLRYVGQVTGNEGEYKALFPEHVDNLLPYLKQQAEVYDVTFRVTYGKKGACTVHPREGIIEHNPVPVEKIFDTTGAGDAYTGGYEVARLRGQSIEDCGSLGTQIASQILGIVGAHFPFSESVDDFSLAPDEETA